MMLKIANKEEEQDDRVADMEPLQEAPSSRWEEAKAGEGPPAAE